MEKKNILSVDDLVVSFSMYKGLFKKENLEVVHSLSLDINEGEIVAVVGSSGSGKSLLAHAVLGLLPKNASTSGKILYEGEELTDKKRSELLGRKIVFIPQSIDYLDPVMKVGKQVQGVYSTKERQEELFEKYKLDKSVEDMYPFQLSGGMARRVLVSSALMEMPRLIVADEPTPGLSVDMAMDTLKHFREIADRKNDEGRDALRHPYSKEFISALPQNEFKSIEGLQPYAGELPKGCLYASRCPYVSEKCSGEIPMRELRGGKVRCVNAT